MRPFPLALCAFFAAAAVAAAQDTPCPIGSPIDSYRVEPIPNGFTTIVGDPMTVNAHFPPADDATVAVLFPATFAFSFYGLPKPAVNVCTNGFADFVPVGSTSFFNEHPGDAAVANDCVMPWHEDLILSNPTSSVDYNFGFPYGPGTLTIQWTDVAHWSAAGFGFGSMTFQAVLYASTHPTLANVVEYRYDRSTAPPVAGPCAVGTGSPSNYAVTATIGTDSASGTSATNIGVDATDRGSANTAYPPCDLRLVPTSFVGGEQDHSATMTLAPAPAFTSIVGCPGTVAIGPPCPPPLCYDDEQSARTDGVVIPLPWKFDLLGRAMASATMPANGFLKLGPGQWGISGAANALLPSTSEPEGMLAAFWDDLEQAAPAAGGPAMYYRVDGTAGCRAMTFEWTNWSTFGGISGDCLGAGGNVSFQVRLYEGSAGSAVGCPAAVAPGMGNDRIEFVYDHAGFVPGPFAATIGWENHKGTLGASLLGSPAIAAPPVDPAFGPAMVVIDQCDFGVVRYYGDRNHNAPPGTAACLPELKTNGVPPRIGNPFGLQVIGASPGGFGVLLLDAGGPIPGTKTPVPCGGFSIPFGTFWVNILSPSTLLLSCGITSPGGPCKGCCKVDLPIPFDPTFVGGVLYAQGAVVSIAPFGLLVELTEGAKIGIGS